MEKRTKQERKKIKEMQVSRVRVVKIRSEESEQQVYMKKSSPLVSRAVSRV